MKAPLADRNTYEVINKPPYKKIERELNSVLQKFKKENKLGDKTYHKLRSLDTTPPSITGSVNCQNSTKTAVWTRID